VLKIVERDRSHSETHCIDEAFEVEDGAPIKYAFLGRQTPGASERRARSHARERVQRLVLAEGWNLVAAAVEEQRAAA
jgi:hypothetical protein